MGGHAKQQNDLLDTQRKKTDSQYDTANAASNDRSNSAYSRQTAGRGALDSGYSGLKDTGGFDPGEYASLMNGIDNSGPAGGYGGGGGSSVANELSSTGGIDESKFAGALAGYQGFADGGGVDAAGLRARANSVIPSFYKNLNNEAARRKMVNPYAPTFDAEQASMARQAGQQSVDNVRNTELDITDKINQGKEFGIAGLGNLNATIQGMKQQGKIAGGSQQISNAGLGIDAGRLNEEVNARKMGNKLDLTGMRNSGRLAGLSGLSGLNSQDAGEAAGYTGNVYGGIGADAGASTNNINSRQDTGAWWKQLAGAAIGGASGVLSGGLTTAAGAAIKAKRGGS